MDDLFSLHLVFKQTDIWLKTDGEPDRRQAEMYLKQAYQDIEKYITYDKEFLQSLHPHMIKICVPSAIEGKGLCTSSGSFGHSINMGRAYAVSILADNACSADVWATAVGNRIRSHLDLEYVLKWCKKKECIEGVVILIDDYLGAWGDIRLSRVE